MTTILIVFAIGCALVVWANYRFWKWQEDGDRHTRWDLEAAHVEHDASVPAGKHGLN